jgi:hypothetical protein
MTPPFHDSKTLALKDTYEATSSCPVCRDDARRRLVHPVQRADFACAGLEREPRVMRRV